MLLKGLQRRRIVGGEFAADLLTADRLVVLSRRVPARPRKASDHIARMLGHFLDQFPHEGRCLLRRRRFQSFHESHRSLLRCN